MYKHKKHRKVLRNSIQGITKNSLKRLSYTAGVTRMSGLMYEELRDVLTVFLKKIIRNTITFTNHCRRKTVSLQDVEDALTFTPGVTKMFLNTANVKRCSVKQSGSSKLKDVRKKTLSKIRYYQKQSKCFHIAKLPFERVVRELAAYYLSDLRFSPEALNLLQASAEKYLVDILKQTLLASLDARHEKLMPKDLQLVRHIRGERG